MSTGRGEVGRVIYFPPFSLLLFGGAQKRPLSILLPAQRQSLRPVRDLSIVFIWVPVFFSAPFSDMS